MFALSKMKVGLTPPIEYKPATSGETFAVGEARALASGKVTKCAATTAPSHVCVGAVNDAGEVPCVAVQPYMEWETTLAAAPSSGTLAPGNKVTLHTDGLQVTATTASGVAEIVEIDGQTVGDRVVVKF